MFAMQFWRMLYPFVHEYVPSSLRSFLGQFIPFQTVRRLREIIYAMDYHSRRIFNEKKAALEKGDEAVIHQVGEGKDILSILCKAFCHACARMRLTVVILVKANMEASEEDRLPDDELVAGPSVPPGDPRRLSRILDRPDLPITQYY